MIFNGPKWIISANGEFGLLQMVLEPDTRKCVRENVGTPNGVDCEILHRLERGSEPSLYKCENLSLIDTF